jgi:hypothetical protein
MKKYFLMVGLIISTIILIGCKSQKDLDNNTFTLDLDNYESEIDLKLSDLIKDCQFIVLETLEESLLGDWIRFLHIGDDYIIILDNRRGVFKFQSNGKFVKKIINVGRGPGEIRGSASHCFYLGSRDILFIEDILANPDVIMRFDIKEETFLSPIKKCFKDRWTDFIVFNDSLILGSIEGFSHGEINPYAIFIQNFKGEFVSGLNSNRSFILPWDGKEEALQRMVIIVGDDPIHVKYRLDNTIFKYKDNKLSPYLIINYNGKKAIPNMLPLEGETGIIFDEYENPSFLIFHYYTLTSWSTISGGWSSAHYKYSNFLFDKSQGKYSKIKSYTDDLIGKTYSDETTIIDFPISQPNNIILVSYSPADILKKASIDGNSDFSGDLIDQLSDIKCTVKETDNPILLTGFPKKKILK